MQNRFFADKSESDNNSPAVPNIISAPRYELHVGCKKTENGIVVGCFHARGIMIPGIKTLVPFDLPKPNSGSQDAKTHSENMLSVVKSVIDAYLKSEQITSRKIIFIGDVNLGSQNSDWPDFLLNNTLQQLYPDKVIYRLLISGTDAVVEQAKSQYPADEAKLEIVNKLHARYPALIRKFDEHAEDLGDLPEMEEQLEKLNLGKRT